MDSEAAASRVALRAFVGWAAFMVALQWPYMHGVHSPDIGTHLALMVDPILRTGRIPTSESYTYFPLHHLIVSGLDLGTGLHDARWVYAIAATALASLLPLVVFAWALPLGHQAAAVAAAISPAAAYTINILGHPSPMTYAIIPGALALAALVSPRARPSVAAVLTLAALTMLIHPYTDAILLCLASLIGAIAWQHGGKWRWIVPSASAVALIAFGAFLYASGTLDLVAQYLRHVTSAGGAGGPASFDFMPAGRMLANFGPTATLIGLAAFGYLSALARGHARLVLVLAPAIALVIGAGVIGMPLAFPDRWFAYLELLALVPLAALALLWLSHGRRRAIAAGCVVVIAGLAPASFVAGAEGSLLTERVAHMRTFLTSEELTAARWAVTSGAPHAQRYYTGPGFLHAEPENTPHSFTVQDGSLQVDDVARPALLLMTPLADRYGAPIAYSQGDRLGGTQLANVRYEPEGDPKVDLLYASPNALVYRLR